LVAAGLKAGRYRNVISSPVTSAPTNPRR